MLRSMLAEQTIYRKLISVVLFGDSLIRATVSSLEVLEYDVLGFYTPTPPISQLLSQFISLRCIRIRAPPSSISKPDSAHHVLSYINELLAREMPPRLMSIEVNFQHCDPFSVLAYITHSTLIPDWQQLDQLLGGSSSRRSQSTKPGMLFIWPYATKSLSEYWVHALDRLLPLSSKRSLITMQMNIDHSDPSTFFHLGESPITCIVVSPTGQWVISRGKWSKWFWMKNFGPIGRSLSNTVENPSDIGPTGMPALCTPDGRYVALMTLNPPLYADDNIKCSIELYDMGNTGVGITESLQGFSNCLTAHPYSGLGLQSTIITQVCSSATKIILMLETGTTVLLDIPTGEITTILSTRARPSLRAIASFNISPDDHWMADWHSPGYMLVWNLEDSDHPRVHSRFTLPTTTNTHSPETEEIVAAAFSSHSTVLVAVSSRGNVWSWDVTTCIPLFRPYRLHSLCHPPSTSTLQFSRDGLRLAWVCSKSHSEHSKLADDDQPNEMLAPECTTSLTVLDLSDPTRPRSLLLRGHDAAITSFSFSPSGTHIATASADMTVRLWKTSNGDCMRVFMEHQACVTCLVFSADGSTLVSGAADGKVCVRELCEVEREKVQEADGHEKLEAESQT
ncbi:WD40-repeat-containing domain protein [Daedaleopsis nitida]|nr:WD40-repeat-containing domain protein [Daedaleopsis nitida]